MVGKCKSMIICRCGLLDERLFLHLFYLGLGLGHLHKLVVARLAETVDLLIEMDAAPGVDGGILALLVREDGSLPVGQLLALGDLLVEEVRIELLQAQVLDAYRPHHVLKIDEVAGDEVLTCLELVKIIVP